MMAKGDSGKAQQQINTQGQRAQGVNTDAQNRLGDFNNAAAQNYGYGVGQNMGDYNEIQQGYRNLANGMNIAGTGSGAVGAPSIGLDPTYQGFLNRGLSGYENFANTGGLSSQDQQDLRARAIAPTRAVYQNAQDNIRRQQALQGGYAPNAIAAQAKTARDLSSAVGDANVNANASIAQMIQQGKLAGLGGMQQGAFGGLDRSLEVARANAAAQTAANNATFGHQLAGLQGMQSLYGQTPGLAQLYGNQALQSNQQMLGAAGLQNQLGSELINGQVAKSQIPGDFQQGLGNVGSVLGLAGGIGGAFMNPTKFFGG